uniref:Uncharacterized protein n=1 Tax=Erythrolobus madagascarensis TaxID=708628 RepID=A0A7S0T5L9_9RHOD
MKMNARTTSTESICTMSDKVPSQSHTPTFSDTSSSSRSEAEPNQRARLVRTHSQISAESEKPLEIAHKRSRLEILRHFYPNEYANLISGSGPQVSTENDDADDDEFFQSDDLCHLCNRHYEGAPQAVCRNVVKGVCSRVICEVCFDLFEWDFEEAVSEDSGWICTHCTNRCPQRTSCSRWSSKTTQAIK